MSDPFSILSTKALHEGMRSEILSLGWVLKEEAFIETSPLSEWSPAQINAMANIDAETAIVFTSEKGLTYFPWGFAPLPPIDAEKWNVACLAGKTLSAVTAQLSAAQVVCTAHNARDLAGAIIAEGRFNRAVFFCALEHRPDLPEALRNAGIPVEEVPIYETRGVPKVVDTRFDAVLFFSPSAVEQFFQLNRLQMGAVCFAIGESTATAIRDYTQERVIASPVPNQEQMLRCIRDYYDNQQCYE